MTSRTAKSTARPSPVSALHLGSGDPVLLLHGFMLSPHCWEQVARRMSAHCEVYAPAFAGHWGGPKVEGWSLDVYALADALWRRGWYLDRQGPPASLHCTVNAVHDGKIDAFVTDLHASLAEVLAAGAGGEQGAYGTVE